MRHASAHPSTAQSPRAVGLRVGNVERAAEFYQAIGFRFVMAVPDENGRWVLCLLRCGAGSILLAPLDHPRFPRSHRQSLLLGGFRGLRARVDVAVPDIGATYYACKAAGCRITAELAQEIWGDYVFSCLDPFGYEWRFTQVAERQTSDRPALAANALWS